jgi:hypothetical protein
MKAQLLLAQEQYDEAVLSYNFAAEIKKEVPTYLGMFALMLDEIVIQQYAWCLIVRFGGVSFGSRPS